SLRRPTSICWTRNSPPRSITSSMMAGRMKESMMCPRSSMTSEKAWVPLTSLRDNTLRRSDRRLNERAGEWADHEDADYRGRQGQRWRNAHTNAGLPGQLGQFSRRRLDEVHLPDHAGIV